MPVLSLSLGEREQHVAFQPGPTLRDTLQSQHLWTLSYCGGGGACGRCRVRVGECREPLTSAERERLTPADISRGVRLACQLRPTTDLRIVLEPTEMDFGWRELLLRQGPRADLAGPPPRWWTPAAPLGAAIDLGTTHLRISMWDVGRRQLLARRAALNPQCHYGADILSRLTAACESPADGQRMQHAVSTAIRDALGEIAVAAGHDPSAIGEVILVGNTAMLALMGLCDGAALLDPDRWTSAIACDPDHTGRFARAWGLAPRGAVHFVPPLAGFVGSDLAAAVAATRLGVGTGGALLVDFGTNSEVALWDGETLWVTSAAGGPAFEGSGSLCGMPAIAGAIRRATLTCADPPRFRCDVIGGGEGEGLTAPAILDVIAELVSLGLVTRGGNLRLTSREGVVVQAHPRVLVAKRDVDAFQRAKAAIAAAVGLLLQRAAPSALPLQRLCVCGVFGEHLQPHLAQSIGLLPPMPTARIESHGQAALAGAEGWLFLDDPAAAATALTGTLRVVNLAHDHAYDDTFIANLGLQPMRLPGRAAC